MYFSNHFHLCTLTRAQLRSVAFFPFYPVVHIPVPFSLGQASNRYTYTVLATAFTTNPKVQSYTARDICCRPRRSCSQLFMTPRWKPTKNHSFRFILLSLHKSNNINDWYNSCDFWSQFIMLLLSQSYLYDWLRHHSYLVYITCHE